MSADRLTELATFLREHADPQKSNYEAVAGEIFRDRPEVEHEGLFSAFRAAGLQKERLKSLRVAVAAEIRAKTKAAREAEQAAKEAELEAAEETAQAAAAASPVASDARYLYSTVAPAGVYTRDDNGEWSPKPTSVEAFVNLHKFEVTTTEGLKKTVTPKWIAPMLRERAYDREAYFYDSAETLVERAGVKCRNLYRKPSIEPVEGDCSLYQALISNLADGDPDGEAYLLDWLAKPLQEIHRGKLFKMGTAIAFYGAEGAGKERLAEALRALYGPANTGTLGQDQLDGKFAGQLPGKLFLLCNEVTSNTSEKIKSANKMKTWVTDKTIAIEAKGVEAADRTNTFNIVFFSNFDEPVYLDPGGAGRRWNFFRQTKPLDRAIGAALNADLEGSQAQLKAFYASLLNRQVSIGYGDLHENEERRQQLLNAESSLVKFLREVMRNGWQSVSTEWLLDERRRTASREFAPVAEVELPSGDPRGRTFVPSATIAKVYQHWCRLYREPERNTRKQLSKDVAALKMMATHGQYAGVAGWFNFGARLALVTTDATDSNVCQGLHVSASSDYQSEWECPSPEFLKWATNASVEDLVSPDWTWAAEGEAS